MNIQWIFDACFNRHSHGRFNVFCGPLGSCQGVSGGIEMNARSTRFSKDCRPNRRARAGPAPHADRGDASPWPDLRRNRAGTGERVPAQHLPEQHTSFPKASDPKGKTREASQPHVWRYQRSRIPACDRLGCVAANAINRGGTEKSRRSNSASLRRPHPASERIVLRSQ